MTAQPPRKRRIASDEASSWARNITLNNSNAKSVLRALAGYVNEEGICFVGLITLAKDCELSISTVRSRLLLLEEVGAIVRMAQWLDDRGRRNGDGRGKRTTDDVRLMMDADPDEIEARARARKLGASEPDDAEEKDTDPPTSDGFSPSPGRGLNPPDQPISPPHGGGLNQVQDSVSHPLALCQPSNYVQGLDSLNCNYEPEESPPYPPPGGAHASRSTNFQDDQNLRESFAPFEAAYPGPVSNIERALDVWRALTAQERGQAVIGARGYAAHLADCERRRKPQAVTAAHTWLKNRQWGGYLTTATLAARAAQSVMTVTGTPQWAAWSVYWTCCGYGGIPEHKISKYVTNDGKMQASMPQEWPPECGPEAPKPWPEFCDGTPQFAAWMRRLRELPEARFSLRSVDGKAVVRVPAEWPPPRKSEERENAVA